MNKQQLANRIWESANKMRSKIEANEYKDYILGFIFYKYLSDKEVKFLIENDYTDELLPTVTEDDDETVRWVQQNLGYFISYNNLFSTWISIGRDFDVSNVTDALSAFNRNISSSHKKVFEKIFQTLETGLSKLGDSSGARTKAISGLLQLIKDIPMDGKQDYDVLGFIYEYLIEKFAANAGKKAGEFYTPHEVSLLMSEIVANHLKGKNEIEIYDSTSGSGSLLINIGKSVSKYMPNSDNIKYYAQELKENTYNLTRMNLVMRGINPSNITTRCADTLEEDWPFFDENDPVNTYETLYVDAVVSNPPFGSKIPVKDKNILEQFELAHIWENNKKTRVWTMTDRLQSSVPPEILFIERCTQFLTEGGRMGIVLPDSILGSPGLGYIREWLIKNHRIIGSVDLHVDTFQPRNGTQTSVLFLQKKTQEQKDAEEKSGTMADYNIFMAMVEKVGHDKRGNPTFKRDKEGNEILVPDTNSILLDGETEESAVVSHEQKKKVEDDQTPDVPAIFADWKKQEGLSW